MTKLTLAFALLLTAASAARAQTPYVGAPVADPHRDALAIKDPVHRDEALIAGANRRNINLEREANAARRAMPQTFKAEVEVTNRAAKAIKFVSWTATLTDPETGAVIRTYDVETRAGIAPGKTRRLSKRLRTPRADVVKAPSLPGRKRPVADLRVEVTGVTYVDGSTSTTP